MPPSRSRAPLHSKSRHQHLGLYEQGVNPDNKVFLAIPDAVHCDLYDGDPEHDIIPWDKVEEFFTSSLACEGQTR